jgi:hypothetical protein
MVRSSNPTQLTTLTEALSFRTVDELKALLQLLPITARPTRKAELVSTIADYLQGSGLKQLWQELDALQQAAVAEAVHITHGEYQAEQFRAKYGQSPKWGDRSTSFYSFRRQPAKLDLFFYRSSTYGPSHLMPADMQAQLRSFVPAPKPLALKSADEVPQVIEVERYYFDYELRKRMKMQEELPLVHCAMERTAQQDLLTVLRLVHLGKLTVSDKTLMPTKATLSEIAPLLQGGDYYAEADSQPNGEPIGAIKPFAWPLMLQAAGLAELAGKKLYLTPAGQKALTAAPAKTLKAVWKKWLKTRVLDELRRIDAIKGQTGKGKHGLTAVDRRRQVIAQVLADCPVGQWVRFNDLKRYMIASDQTFEVSRNPENLYFSEAGYGNLYNAGDHWSFLQTSYLQCFLFEYAATLGLLDLAYIPPYDAPRQDWDEYWGTDDLAFLSRYDGLVALRLTPLGAFCLGLEATYEASPITTAATLRVLPNLDIVMTGQPLSPSETLMMDTFCLKTADAVWKLDRETLLKAAEGGHSLKEFQSFLTQASAHKLPETVQHFFRDGLSRADSLQDLGLTRLIECADATLATLIAHDSRTKKYCQLAGDRHLVVSLEQETRFRNGLRKLGYTLPLSST